MGTPFPGMDPYLEHPALWPDVHDRLIAAIADTLTPLVAPRYYVGLERRTYLLKPDDVVFIGRPDIAVVAGSQPQALRTLPLADVGVMEVDVPMSDEEEPLVNLGAILHALYERARFDLRLDYTQPPVPPFSEEDAAWSRQLLEANQ